MIPCPYCERGFEKRAGLMRHVTASHHSEGAVPTNPGGAIEPVIPVDPEPEGTWEKGYVVGNEWHPAPETYAESLTDEQLAPGQEPYVDPPPVVFGSTSHTIFLPAGAGLPAAVSDMAPSIEQYRLIRQLRREGRPEPEAWMTVVGYPPPPRETPTEDSRPLRLQQVAFRVRNTEIDQIDATWLLRLVEIGRDAVAQLGYHQTEMHLDSTQDLIDRWNETIA